MFEPAFFRLCVELRCFVSLLGDVKAEPETKQNIDDDHPERDNFGGGRIRHCQCSVLQSYGRAVTFFLF